MQYGVTRDKLHNIVTKISVRGDYPTGCASSFAGANIDSCAFNLDFISERNPVLAIEIQELYKRAWDLRNNEPLEPGHEDFKLAHERLLKLSNQ